ncbi:MAG: HEAT repeat domain-containing protein [Polyangiaceae bacterium]
MAASPLVRISQLLAHPDPDRRVAAAIVLGELKVKDAAARKALAATLADGGPRLQRHALEALAQIGASSAVDAILPLLGSPDAGVRAAAVEALVSVGESVVGPVQARLAEADHDERRTIDAVLARLGGKEAFSALLSGLADADEQEATAAAVAMRAQIKDADAKRRKTYFAQLTKVLDAQAKLASQKDGEPNVAAIRAALKIIGYLEDPKSVAVLQAYATSKKQPASVRQEALLALRFALANDKPDAKLVSALVEAAGHDDRALAQTALITLAGLSLPARTAARLYPLLAHPDLERAKFVIDMLAHNPSRDAAEVLVQVVAEQELRRAKLAADALQGRAEVLSELVDALVATDDRERSRLLVRVIQPSLAKLKKPLLDKLRAAIVDHLQAGTGGYQGPLELLREADPDETAKALREVYAKLKRRQPPERATAVLRMICRGEMASQEDRYELASRLLAQSHLDTSTTARRGDTALQELERLVNSGYDVVKALGKDRALGLETLYYVGFHFVEEGHPLGDDLLQHVIEKGGRKKVATMAKNKLRLDA